MGRVAVGLAMPGAGSFIVGMTVEAPASVTALEALIAQSDDAGREVAKLISRTPAQAEMARLLGLRSFVPAVEVTAVAANVARSAWMQAATAAVGQVVGVGFVILDLATTANNWRAEEARKKMVFQGAVCFGAWVAVSYIMDWLTRPLPKLEDEEDRKNKSPKRRRRVKRSRV